MVSFGYAMNELNNPGVLESCGPASDFLSYGSNNTGLLTMPCEFDHHGISASGTSGSPWVTSAVISKGIGAVEKGTFPCSAGAGSGCVEAGIPLGQGCAVDPSNDPHCTNVSTVGDAGGVPRLLEK